MIMMRKTGLNDFAGLVLIAAGICVLGLLVGNVLIPSSSHRSSFHPAAVPQKSVRSILPNQQIHDILKNTDSQIIEGFNTIELASATGKRPSRLGTVQSWWALSNNPERKVVWQSAVCPEKKKTTLVFCGVLGMGEGKAALLVNGISALIFSVGPGPPKESWENGSYLMTFLATKIHPSGERFGLFFLTVPEEVVSPDKPIRLEVRGFTGKDKGKSYFMLSGIRQSLPKLK